MHDKQEISPQALITAHARDPQALAVILRGAKLVGQDLSGLDLSGADLSGADLSHCILHATNLSDTVTEGTLFSGILVGDLLAAGLASSAILNTRYQANEQLYQAHPPGESWEAMVFTPETTTTTHLAGSLSDAECHHVCVSLSSMCWENLHNGSIFEVLYPDVPWCQWMLPFALMEERAGLDWVVCHWKVLDEVLANMALDTWELVSAFEDANLSEGIAADPYQVLCQVVFRQALEEDQGSARHYPASPWGNAPEITQLRSSVEARYEGFFLPSFIGWVRQDYASYLERGVLFLYHVGPPLPGGSTALVSASGRVWRHETAMDRAAADRELQLLNAWLATFNAGGTAHRWLGVPTREALDQQQVVERLRQASIARVIWDIDWYSDQTQCTVLACYTEEGKQVPLPQPLDDVDFWRLAGGCPGNQYLRGTFELLVQQEYIRSLNEFPELLANRWNWEE